MKKGGGLELIVASELKRYGAAIRQVSPPVRVLRWGKGNRFTGCFETNGALDFQGSVAGHHVEFDCKDVKGERFDFNKIRPGQMEWATNLLDTGAVVGWLVRFRHPVADHDELWWIGHAVVLAEIEDGSKSINRKRLHEIDGGECVVFHPLYFGRALIKHFQFLVDRQREL